MKLTIFTKKKYLERLYKVFAGVEAHYFTIDNIDDCVPEYFDMGISYCYPRLITKKMIDGFRLGIINYHNAPLPEYAGGDPYQTGADNKVHEWRVTAHEMNEEYDKGKIEMQNSFDIGYPVSSRDELGAIAHYEGFKFLKKTWLNIYVRRNNNTS